MARKKKTTETTIEQVMNTIVNETPQAVIEDVKPEEKKIEERTPERQAVWDFCQKWNSLKNHNIISDEDAREIHKYWQIAAKRTDYYVNCSVCIIQRIKYLKKKALQYGYECKK